MCVCVNCGSGQVINGQLDETSRQLNERQQQLDESQEMLDERHEQLGKSRGLLDQGKMQLITTSRQLTSRTRQLIATSKQLQLRHQCFKVFQIPPPAPLPKNFFAKNIPFLASLHAPDNIIIICCRYLTVHPSITPKKGFFEKWKPLDVSKNSIKTL